MKSKKTVRMEVLIDKANIFLASKESFATKEFKDGVCSMLELAMRETNFYKGFMFLNNEDSDFNTLGYFSRKYFK